VQFGRVDLDPLLLIDRTVARMHAQLSAQLQLSELTSATTTTTPVLTSSKTDSQTGPVVLGSIALAVAVIAAALGGVAFVRSRGRSGAA